MSAATVIKEIKRLPPGEQVEVIHFAFKLAQTRPLTRKELTRLARRMATSDNLAEVTRLKSSIMDGFYGK